MRLLLTASSVTAGDNTAIVVALIAAVGAIIASGVGAWRKFRGDRSELATATVYKDLQKARDELDAARGALYGAQQQLFEIREELERATERLSVAQRRADRFAKQSEALEERVDVLAQIIRANGIEMP